MHCPQTWTKKEVLALRAEVEAMSEEDREKFDETWSREHYGQHYGRYPLLPYHDGATCTDMLHAFINEVNDALEEAIQSHLMEEHTEPELKALQAKVRDEINKRLKGWKGEGGANLLLTFGVDGKKHKCNGPKLKALLRDPKLLSDLIKIMRPLYELMETKDHPLVRPPPKDLAGMFDDAVDETPACEKTLFDMCSKKKGGKKKSGRGAHLNKQKDARPRIGPGAGVGAGATQQREADATRETEQAAQGSGEGSFD